MKIFNYIPSMQRFLTHYQSIKLLDHKRTFDFNHNQKQSKEGHNWILTPP